MAEFKFYKTSLAGLKIVVGDPDTEAGEVAPRTVDFEAYQETYQGDPVKVGYLKTDNAVAMEILAEDVNVTEIKGDEYKNATDPKTAVRATV